MTKPPTGTRAEESPADNPPATATDDASTATPNPGIFEIAVLPLLNTTLFPGTIVPLAAGRARSVAAVEAALATEEKLIACISARAGRAEEQEATSDDLYEVGTLVMIKRMMRSPDALQIIVQGTERVRVVEWTQAEPFLRARVHVLAPPRTVNAEEVEALWRNVKSLLERALAMLPEVPPEIRAAVLGSNDPVQLAYFLGSVLNLGLEQEQAMLEADTADLLLQLAYSRLAREIDILQLRSKIATEAQGEMDKAQRDYILRQQMKAIQKELGEDEGGERAEAELLRERLAAADLPDDVRKEAERELQADGASARRRARLSCDSHVSGIHPRTAVAQIIRRPARSWWRRAACSTKTTTVSKMSKNVFSSFSRSSNCVPTSKSPILCFVGPPGVGKTSLGRSIARALGREFERLRWAGCATKRSCAVIVAPTSARCRDASSSRCVARASTTP